MKYYVIAGEPSGDLHAANLMTQLSKLESNANFRFWGGDLMKNVGGTMVKHYRDTAFMGVFEVVANIKTILNNFSICEKDIVQYKPDILILVDYPGFNLRIAKFAHKKGIKVFYYISPKLWAWNTKRVKKVKKYVDEMFTILPFETKFYQKYKVRVNYVGNPIMDSIQNRKHKGEDFVSFVKRNSLDDRPVVGILAGSRKQELERILPDMLKMIPEFPGYQFIIAGAPSFTLDDYKTYIKDYDVKVLFNETHQILQQSRAAMVTSGTATLEAGLLNCPQVVCYKMWGSWFTNFMAKKIIMKVPFISLVNLILEREAVKELFQGTFSLEALKKELGLLLENDNHRNKLFSDYKELRELTGDAGPSKRAAELMFNKLTIND